MKNPFPTIPSLSTSLLAALQPKKILCAAALLGLCAVPSASAQLQWDPGITGGPAGGTGAWNTTDNFWWNGTANTPWVNGSGNNASFGGTAGTVTQGVAITAGGLNFGVAGYIIDMNNQNLSLTGLSGSAATIQNNISNSNTTLTLAMAADTTWAGTIGSGSNTGNVRVEGGNELTVANVIRSDGAGQRTLTITGSGTRLNLSGTSSTFSGNLVTVQDGATFDIGNNIFNARNWASASGTTVTSSHSTARIRVNSQFNNGTLAGTISGSLGVELAVGLSGTNALTIGGSNTYTGGTYFTASSGANSTIRVTSNTGLGTGVVQMNNTGTSQARLELLSTAPTIGSLSSTGAGTKSIILGDTSVNTNLTINQLAAGTFGGVISEFAGQTGSLTKTGAETLTLSGVNTFTGNTTISDGGLTLASTGELRFRLQDSNVSNSILGTGILTANGLFRLDITGLTASTGTWNLVNTATLTESFGGTFNLAFLDNTTFTNQGGGVYTSGDWTFTTATGNLQLIPEPSSALLLIAGLGLLLLRQRARRQQA
jgi:autotransporter-associated beta strand protein